MQGGLGLLLVLGDDHALAQGQAVGLDDSRVLALGLDVLQSGGGVGKDLIPRGGDAVLLHQVLGEHLAGLNLGGGGVGAKAGDTRGLQEIHHAGGQGVVRGHKHQIHLLLLGQGQHALLVHGVYREARCVPADAPVARGAEHRLNLGAFFQLADNGVLPPAAADN